MAWKIAVAAMSTLSDLGVPVPEELHAQDDGIHAGEAAVMPPMV